MVVVTCFLQGLFELVGLSAFIGGYIANVYWLMLIGGLLVVLDDIFEIATGILNPLVPILLAIVLAILFSPWYVGVFWASAAFKVLGIPTSLMKLFAPKRFVRKSLEAASGRRMW